MVVEQDPDDAVAGWSEYNGPALWWFYWPAESPDQMYSEVDEEIGEVVVTYLTENDIETLRQADNLATVLVDWMKLNQEALGATGPVSWIEAEEEEVRASILEYDHDKDAQDS